MTTSGDAEEVPAWYDEDPDLSADQCDGNLDDQDGHAELDDCDPDDEFDGSFVLDAYAAPEETGLELVAPGELGLGDVFVLDSDAVEELLQVLEVPVPRDAGWVVQVAAGRRRRVLGCVWLPAQVWVYRLWHNRLQSEPFAGLELPGGQGIVVAGTVSYRMVPVAADTGVVDVVDVAVELTGPADRRLNELLAGESLHLVAWRGPHESWSSIGSWWRTTFELTGPAAVDGRTYSWRTPRDLSEVVSAIGPLAVPPSFLSTAAAGRTCSTEED